MARCGRSASGARREGRRAGAAPQLIFTTGLVDAPGVDPLGERRRASPSASQHERSALGVGVADHGVRRRDPARRRPAARRRRARSRPPAPRWRAPRRPRAPRRRGRRRRGPCRPRRSPSAGRRRACPGSASACTAAVPGSRGPAQVPITPWPCRGRRSRSSRDVLARHVGDRAVKTGPRAARGRSEQLLELGAVGEAPTQVSRRRRPQRAGGCARRGLVGEVASTSPAEQPLPRGRRGPRRVDAHSTEVPSSNGHHRSGRRGRTRYPRSRRPSSSTTSGCSSPTT